MRSRLVNNKRNVTPDETLKVTTLLYLKDALIEEKYEEVPALIKAAKRYGAKQSEIKKEIIKYVRRLQRGQKVGGEYRPKTRPRF